MSTFKPLLASPVDFSHLDYSNLWGSVKLDGIRCVILKGVAMSRSLKPIPNKHVQKLFGDRPELEGYDGELIVGPPNASDVYLATNSGVMSQKGEPDVKFHVFDRVDMPSVEYHKRYTSLVRHPRVEIVEQECVPSLEDLLEMESHYLSNGYEGVMLRAYKGPASFYKFGRSTSRENTLLKLKRMASDEAEIIGVEEEMANNNEATTDALGHTTRTSHQANMVGKGRLGSLVCRTADGIVFNIGTGFDAKTRQSMWDTRGTLPGQFASYNHFPVGAKDAPRFPSFKGLRDVIDM